MAIGGFSTPFFDLHGPRRDALGVAKDRGGTRGLQAMCDSVSAGTEVTDRFIVDHLGVGKFFTRPGQPSFFSDVLDAAVCAGAIRSDGGVVDSVALADRTRALGEGKNSLSSEIGVTGQPLRGVRWSTRMFAALMAID